MTPFDTFKRVFDIFAAAVALFLTWPIMLLVALLVRLNLGSPVLFKQTRPGRDGRPFTLIKFRSMKDPARGLESDEDRITKFGQVLRSTSLDELPELINVLRGEMSLVGPRPLLMDYLPLYTPRQQRRHEVRPGLTGLAQVKGRNAVAWGERLGWDVYYVEHRSLVLDLKILWQSVAVVLVRHGITEEGQVTVTEFQGAEDVEVDLTS